MSCFPFCSAQNFEKGRALLLFRNSENVTLIGNLEMLWFDFL
jgi:hypothetical protein